MPLGIGESCTEYGLHLTEVTKVDFTVRGCTGADLGAGEVYVYRTPARE